VTSPSPNRKPTQAKKSWLTRRPRRPLPAKTGWRHLVPRWRTSLWVLFGLLVAGVATVAVLFAVIQVPKPNPDVSSQATIIYYADGKNELGRVGAQNRQIVALSQIPIGVRNAVMAAEDKGFYSEPGISLVGIPRALLSGARGNLQGGSGITQQYVKNAYLTSERSITRKVKEAVIAVKINRVMTKDEILADYLNTIWFGRGASGIQAASQAYFHKDVSKLSIAEGAVLAGSIRNPAANDPTANPEQAKTRWAEVTKAMLDDGFIDQATYSGLKYPTVQPPTNQLTVTGPERFIVNSVVDELQNKDGFTDADIQTKGLRVVTTIDRTAQVAADNAEKTVFVKAVGAAKKKPVSSLISIEPGTGRVKAMYGGADYANGGCRAAIANCLNLATQILRQPGSSFKPFVLSTALANNHTLQDRFNGPSQTTLPDGTPVKNDAEGETCSNCTLVEAMARSINTIYEPLAATVGPSKVADQAHVLGIPTTVPLADANGFTGASIALGAYAVHPVDMATAYATFAANGVQADPYFVEAVKGSNGKTLYQAKPNTKQVLDKGIAADVTTALQAVVTLPGATGTAAALDGGRPVAGKTGTTDQSKDAWFVGFTPQLVTAVWAGNVDNSSTIGQLPGLTNGLYGGNLPAQTFKAYMDGALKGQPVKQFPAPTSASPSATPSTSSSSATPSSTSASPSTTSATPTVAPTTTTPPSATSTSASPPPSATDTASQTAASPSAAKSAQASAAPPSAASPAVAAPSG
jgi:membrane peptidoglycan carboxypeptidase